MGCSPSQDTIEPLVLLDLDLHPRGKVGGRGSRGSRGAHVCVCVWVRESVGVSDLKRVCVWVCLYVQKCVCVWGGEDLVVGVKRRDLSRGVFPFSVSPRNAGMPPHACLLPPPAPPPPPPPPPPLPLPCPSLSRLHWQRHCNQSLACGAWWNGTYASAPLSDPMGCCMRMKGFFPPSLFHLSPRNPISWEFSTRGRMWSWTEQRMPNAKWYWVCVGMAWTRIRICYSGKAQIVPWKQVFVLPDIALYYSGKWNQIHDWHVYASAIMLHQIDSYLFRLWFH